ncbi:MAG TPA: glycosyltransferase [Mycobacteriales bacterium]|nr:glycosyltransferase [Mycobacteriales bacterium]
MAGSAPDVTVVIPTHRRPQSLRRALEGLAGQQADFRWDVVVVDNDADGSAQLAVAAAARSGLPVTYVAEARAGAAYARNTGVDIGTGAVLAFLDDDVMPQPGWLAAVAAPVLAGRAVAAGGPVVLDPQAPRARWFDEDALGGYLSGFALPVEVDELRPQDILLTANLAVRREALAAVGGFDPDFGPRGRTQLVADDALLVRRLRRGGGRLVYVPAAVVVHELPPSRMTRGYLLRRAYLQGRSDWMLDRIEHAGRRFGGARPAVVHATAWLRHRHEDRNRRAASGAPARFELACDVARYLGTLREAARSIMPWWRRTR